MRLVFTYLLVSIFTGFGATSKSAAEDFTNYRELKEFFDGNCLGCHRDIARAGGLNLERFPFVSELRQEPVGTIVARMLGRMQDPKYPMPPGSTLPAEQIARVQEWLEQGLPE